MAVLGHFFKFEPKRSIAAASIGSGLTAVGLPLSHSAHQFIIQNDTDVPLTFSIDGIADHFELPALSIFIDDNNANRSNNHLYIGTGETLYVRYAGNPPSVGSVNFSVMYGYKKGTGSLN